MILVNGRVSERSFKRWRLVPGTIGALIGRFDLCLTQSTVDAQRFAGTCYRAANWIHVGQTAGRGRMDRHTLRQEPVKNIYLYPLLRHAPYLLCGLTR